ncbi:MAG: FMN-binding protein [Erysipelotrichaceae bacterium]|nr:FMN-binding protein [Erysipelotrichaceae bacterium]
MGKIIKLAVFLAAISGLSGLCLSFVNSKTAPIIEEQSLAAEKGYLEEMFPGASFTVKEVSGDYVTTEYTASTGGKAYKIVGKGYGGDVVVIVGFNDQGKVVGYDAIDISQETQGFGSKVGEDEFKKSVLSASVDSGIDTITGATITSSVVVDGFSEAAELFNE